MIKKKVIECPVELKQTKQKVKNKYNLILSINQQRTQSKIKSNRYSIQFLITQTQNMPLLFQISPIAISAPLGIEKESKSVFFVWKNTSKFFVKYSILPQNDFYFTFFYYTLLENQLWPNQFNISSNYFDSNYNQKTFFSQQFFSYVSFNLFFQDLRSRISNSSVVKTLIMEKTSESTPVYDPPFFLHKIHNYQKAVYERKGHWTQRQKIKYGVFLQIFRHKFEDRKDPVLNKMFRVMSDFVKTRNHNQCRSHHQKMEKQRFQIDSILESIRSKYHPRQYELFFEKYSKHIKAVNVDSVLNQKGFTPHKNVQKRKKIKTPSSQAQMISEIQDAKDLDGCQKLSKIENIEPISEVLNCGMGEQKINQNKILLQKQKQNEAQNQISSKSKEEHAPQLIIRNPITASEKALQQKKDKALKKTASDYDDDESEESESPKKQSKHPYAVVYDIPPRANQMNFLPSNYSNRLNIDPGIGMGLASDFMNPMSQMSVGPQFSASQFDSYLGFESQFHPPVFRMNQSQVNYEENLVIDTKSLEEKKKWHLSEASRLCLEMNDHLQKASNCQQMMEMMKKMTEPKRGASYFYPSGYLSSQF